MKEESVNPSRLDRLCAWSDRRSELLNAILIREIRRTLNGKFFVISFLILLALCLFWTLEIVFLGTSSTGRGGPMFTFFCLSLCGVTFLGLPLMVSELVGSELKEQTLELLSITTITAARIVWGEMMTALGLFVLFASAVTPFMAFSYLLGGIDLRTIASGVAMAFLTTMFLSLVAVLGSLQKSGAMIKVALGILAGIAFSLMAGLVGSGHLEELWDSPDIGIIILSVLSTYLTLMGILFTAATARLTFASANRAGPLRLAIVVHLLQMGGLCFWGNEAVVWGWAIYSISVLFLAGYAIIGEDEALSRRLLRAGPLRRHLPGIYALFLPGARRGLAFLFAVGALVTLLATVAMMKKAPTLDLWDEAAVWAPGTAYAYQFPQGERVRVAKAAVWVPGTAYAYLVLFLSSAHGLCALLPAAFQRPFPRRVLLIVLFLATSLLPPIACLLMETRMKPAFAAINPIFYFPVIYGRDHIDDFSNTLPITITLLSAAAVVFLAMLIPLSRGIAAARPKP